MSLLSDRLGQLSNNIFGANVFDVRKDKGFMGDTKILSWRLGWGGRLFYLSTFVHRIFLFYLDEE